MSFSDWITIVSILLAVLLAVFKFDEWEVIRLKKFERYIVLPILLLMLSGISAYFQKNKHPDFLNVFWSNNGFQTSLWPIIWMLLFVGLSFHQWKKLINRKPTHNLILKYVDYLDTYEPSKFSQLFRKYERFFFNSHNEESWLPYELILTNPKWWSFAPKHFKSMVNENPSRFYKMDTDVLRSLLLFQLSNIPVSQITEELESQWNGMTEETPLLNIFFSTPDYIEFGRDRNILLPTIKTVAVEYFSSVKYFEKDRAQFLLKPSENAQRQVAPKSLIPFYFIELINCYWFQVIKTKANVSGFYFYQTWTENVLELAPKATKNSSADDLPNLYVFTVGKMLSNIDRWSSEIILNDVPNLVWAAEHFEDLKLSILKKIEDRFIDRVPHQWLISQTEIFLNQLISNRKTYKVAFNSNIEINSLTLELVTEAFKNITNNDFFSESEKNHEGYQWLKGIITNGTSDTHAPADDEEKLFNNSITENPCFTIKKKTSDI